ncbi:serine hydrolase domain-containing protein [Tabrizicola fusiformis]|uniref:serine hydrolase domain-containing protein n=1 Tax=Tabrizicola sp. SY72 TaxID=2741673 RepID=UPI001573140F|nr:serine hydrolase [Tabrizicola sp. SY72]NTT86069.1 serine hydrolase [Tabrizicola sp. SY72]
MQADRPAGLDLSNWDRAPFNRWSYQHLAEIVPVAPIACAATPLPLPEAPAQAALDQVNLPLPGNSTAARLLAGSWTDGLIALHRGQVVCSHYENGLRPDTPHLTQSVSKSVVGAVAGVLHGAGDLDLNRSVAAYVPDFAGSAYAAVTIRQLLDMTSGVDFPEDAPDPASGIGLMDIAVGWKPAPPGTSAPRSLRTLIRSLRHQTRPHGAEFEYRSMETEVLGFCLEAAASAPLPQLVSDLIWQPMGAAHPASFGLDPEGATIADGALSATLPDLARFGLIFAQEGAANGRQIVPADWVAQTRQGDASRFPARYRADRPNGAYRNQFWIEDTARPVTLALGVYGQMIFIDPARDFVGVKLSTWPMALNPALRLQTQCLMHSLARACGPQAN